MKMRWGKFLDSLSRILPMLQSDDDYRLSWANRIKSYDEVPDIYKFTFQPLLEVKRDFPYTVLTPTFENRLHSRTTEKLIYALDLEIYVLERVADTVKVYCFPVENISCVEVRIVLLISQITITGITKDRLPASITIQFNTVTEALFTPILEKIRRKGSPEGDGGIDSEIEKFTYLRDVNYKFMNYARRSYMGGERILQVILQPRIQERVFQFFGRTFYRVISPAHLSILTDQEFILIRELENRRSFFDYGKAWIYIQLKKIISLSLDEGDGECSTLSIELPEGVYIKSLFQPSARQEVGQLLALIGNSTN